ncbi:hypothetical protein NZ698_07225 [Chryseobacterium sp. PBS4-4]|uniref:Uncharacterized protein n=1 Tax=Chryseobacterium edaphi TaxID=2976532 RepID=A0ABT2W6F2_9FLAO|nr:hypothetical protein [Chryseobacterium edaphi]MCU7616984.1 hypothetical protein [Chryseobacterium edaphi]
MKNLIFIFSIFCCTFVSAQKNQNYIEIGYSSICCGTPSTDPVMNYVNQFQKKNKTKNFEILRQSGLGREGEFNLYIGTDQLSKTQKVNFKKGLQSAITAQNTKRNQNSDGIVNFEGTKMVTKADLSKIKNLIIYKK